MGAEIDSEPTSPKVTCAGQIKVRPRSDGHNPCKTWQTVMEEIERIHKSRSRRSRMFGFKKDVLNFLACLRKVKFDFRCFGSFPQTDVITDDEAEEEEEEEDEVEEEEEEKSTTVFSKWFMVLQEDQKSEEKQRSFDNSGEDDSSFQPAVPPPNALLLMRCRSAPAKSWLENKKEEEYKENKENYEKGTEETEEKMKKEKKKDLRSLMEEERLSQKENLVVMRYDADFYKLSADIAKETWVVGGINNPLPRTRSLRR